MKEAVLGVVGKHFRPEFINRIDEMVVFHPLDQAQIKRLPTFKLIVYANAWLSVSTVGHYACGNGLFGGDRV